MSTDNAAITPAPAPWKCRATVYSAVFWVSASQVSSPDFNKAAYAPLERDAPFAMSGKPEGGLATVMLVRYKDTPVGSYDEMMLLPGKFGFDGRSKLRITRIYVSQRNTTWNGRTSECTSGSLTPDWNIPKHLARFDFQEHADGSADCKVYPLAEPSETPVFQARFQPMRYVPPMPMSTRAYGWLGIDLEIAQPPLPAGPSEATEAMLEAAREHGQDAARSELAGTDKWCSSTPYQYSSATKLGWMDLRQADGGNFLPGAGRWAMAIKMTDTDLRLGESTWWEPSKL